MQQRIIATTPTLLLASAFASVAQTVGGYKEEFNEAEAGQQLHDLFTADIDDDRFHAALSNLRSVWDRAEGASQVLDNVGNLNASIEIDLGDTAMTINGIDTRSELLIQVATTSALLDASSDVLKEASKLIASQAAEIRKLKAMVAVVAGTQPMNMAEAAGDAGKGYVPPADVQRPCDSEAGAHADDYIKAA